MKKKCNSASKPHGVSAIAQSIAFRTLHQIAYGVIIHCRCMPPSPQTPVRWRNNAPFASGRHHCSRRHNLLSSELQAIQSVVVRAPSDTICCRQSSKRYNLLSSEFQAIQSVVVRAPSDTICCRQSSKPYNLLSSELQFKQSVVIRAASDVICRHHSSKWNNISSELQAT